MTRAGWILGGLLAASLLLNLEQWGRGRKTHRPETRRNSQTGVLSAPVSGAGAPARGGPRARLPAPGARASLPKTCPDQLRDLGQRLADAEQKLDRYLPPDKRFEKGAPSPALTSRIARALAPILEDAPDGWSHDLECRADVCRLNMIQGDGSDHFDWMDRIQHQRPEGVTGMMFEASRPGQDPVTKEPLTSQAAYLKVNADAQSGAAILGEVLDRFHGGGAVSRCQAAYPDANGYWSIRLDLTPDTRRITLWQGGTLAATQIGSCFRAALDQIIEGTTLPDAFTGAVRFDTVSLPAGVSPRLSQTLPRQPSDKARRSSIAR